MQKGTERLIDASALLLLEDAVQAGHPCACGAGGHMAPQAPSSLQLLKQLLTGNSY